MSILYDLLRKNNSPDWNRIQNLVRYDNNLMKQPIDESGRYLLHYACWKQAPSELVAQLINDCPKACEEKDKSGWLPLHLACRWNQSESVIQLLITTYPKACEEKVQGGVLPLHIACRYNQFELVIEALVTTYQQAIKEKDDEGWLPLHVACCFNQSEVVIEFLVTTYPKACAERTNDGALSLLPCAPATNHSESIIQSESLLQLLINRKVCEGKTNYGCYALHLACHYNHSLAVIQLLITNYRYACKGKDNDGWLPLHYAFCYNPSESVIELLITNYPKALEERTNDGGLPLHYARAKNQSESINQLLTRNYPKALEEKINKTEEWINNPTISVNEPSRENDDMTLQTFPHTISSSVFTDTISTSMFEQRVDNLTTDIATIGIESEQNQTLLYDRESSIANSNSQTIGKVPIQRGAVDSNEMDDDSNDLDLTVETLQDVVLFQNYSRETLHVQEQHLEQPQYGPANQHPDDSNLLSSFITNTSTTELSETQQKQPQSQQPSVRLADNNIIPTTGFYSGDQGLFVLANASEQPKQPQHEQQHTLLSSGETNDTLDNSIIDNSTAITSAGVPEPSGKKRPRNPYTIFLQVTRERLRNIPKNQQQTILKLPFTRDDIVTMRSPTIQKRKHRPTDGIGFKELTQLVTARWKTFSDEERNVFVDYYNTVERPNHYESKSSAKHNACVDTSNIKKRPQYQKRTIVNNDNGSSNIKKRRDDGSQTEKKSTQMDLSLISDEDSNHRSPNSFTEMDCNENAKSKFRALPDRGKELLSKATGTISTAAGASSLLLDFLMENQECLKCSVQEYYEWLISEDVDTMENFVAAIQDDDFAPKMKQNGIKGFKMSFLEKACVKKLDQHNCRKTPD